MELQLSYPQHPLIRDPVAEGKVVSWLKSVGDKVKKGEVSERWDLAHAIAQQKQQWDGSIGRESSDRDADR